MDNHSQLPWKYSPWHIEEGPPAVLCKRGYVVCTTASNADADLIAKAVNGYEPMVEALLECKTFLNDLTSPDAKATGASIIASFANAVSLRLKVINALAASPALLQSREATNG